MRSTTVTGSYSSSGFQSVTLEFFSSAASGEGRTYLGSDTVFTGFFGTASFTTVLPVAVPGGEVVTATVGA